MLGEMSGALRKAEPGLGCSKPVLEFTMNQTREKKMFHLQAFEKNCFDVNHPFESKKRTHFV